VTGGPVAAKAFLFGVATADHQCEAFVPAMTDIRDAFDQRLKLTQRGNATGFWDRYREDVELAAGLGCRAFRFSVAWARVEPVAGQVDQAVLDHYVGLAEHIRATGMEPIVTLHHNTWPLHIERSGGLTGPAFPQRFADYTSIVARRLTGLVRYWITINEPTELVFGYVKPWWDAEYRMPPGQDPSRPLDDQLGDVALLIPNLFLAHKLAREAVQAAIPGALVSANPLIIGLPWPLRLFLDEQTRRLRDQGHLVKHLASTANTVLPRRGNVDLVLALMSATPDRAMAVDYSIPYSTGCLRILVPAASQSQQVSDVSRGPLAVLKGASAELAAQTYLPHANLLKVPTYSAGLDALRRGRAVGLLGDEVVVNVLAGPANRLLLGDIGAERYVVGVPKGRALLLAAVNRVIESDGALGAGSAPKDLTVEPGWLTVGVRGSLPGISFQEADGSWTGTEIVLARQLAEYIVGDPNRVRFEAVPTNDKVRQVRSWWAPADRLLRALTVAMTLLNSNWWHLGMAGELPEWLCPANCAGKQDFVGLDYYWGVPWYRFWRLGRLAAAATGQFQSAPVWPGGLRSALHYLRRKFPDQKILIVENGSVVVADGITREDYLLRHIGQLGKAIHQGVKVLGYLCWSITTNREWGLNFGPGNDFGLFHIDLDGDPNLIRKPIPSATLYSDLIGAFAAPDTMRQR